MRSETWSSSTQILGLCFYNIWMQKKNEKFDMLTQIAWGKALLCLVWSWIATVRRIWTYPGALIDTPIFAVWKNSWLEHITSNMLMNALKAALEAIGYEVLDIEKREIDTHLIRPGIAIMMYLRDVPAHTIIMIGRWLSDAFLWYICKHVEQFSHKVSKKMI